MGTVIFKSSIIVPMLILKFSQKKIKKASEKVKKAAYSSYIHKILFICSHIL